MKSERQFFLRLSVPTPMLGLLNALPESRSWSRERRAKFLETFGTVLDYCVSVEPDESVAKLSPDE